MAEAQKAELKAQISQLSEMSGDSSQQMVYLNEQLREKDRLIEELQGQHSFVSGELERVKEETSSKSEQHVSTIYDIVCFLLPHIGLTVIITIHVDLSLLQQQFSLYVQLAEMEQLRLSLNNEKGHSASLEKELTQTDKAASDLQVELTSTQQELQEALDLCSQHETLIVERNDELASLETKVRLVHTCTCSKSHWFDYVTQQGRPSNILGVEHLF